MKITDKARLDWLRKHKWKFYSADIFQLDVETNSFARYSPRQAIDAAILVERSEARMKVRAERGKG